jgi:arsenate reductase
MKTSNKMPDVLFVCTHNSGRSQMAQAFFNAIGSKLNLDLSADSAGTNPAERVHPVVVDAMRELDFDLSGERPKLLTNDMVLQSKKIIAMGCTLEAEACPAIVIQDIDDWKLPDPKNKGIEEVRTIRNAIRQKVEALIDLISSSN